MYHLQVFGIYTFFNLSLLQKAPPSYQEKLLQNHVVLIQLLEVLCEVEEVPLHQMLRSK